MTAAIGAVNLTILTQNLAQVSVSTTRKPLAIIGPTGGGTATTPTLETRKNTLLTDFISGPTVEAAAYALAFEVPKVVVVKTRTSDEVAGSYGTITVDSVDGAVAGDGTIKPSDDFEVAVEVLTGFTVGTTGGVYRYSLDGGRKWSNPTALGTASFIQLPYGGGKYGLTASDVWLPGEGFSLVTTAPKWATDGLVAGLGSLKTNTLPFGTISIIGPIATSAEILAIQAAIIDLREKVKYARAVGHFRSRAPAESLSTYLAAYQALVTSVIDDDCLGLTVSCYAPSAINPGAEYVRPLSWAFAPRLAKTRQDISADSRTEFGYLKVRIRDANGQVAARAVDDFESGGFTAARAIAGRTWPDKPDSLVAIGDGVTLAADGSDTANYRVAQVLDLAAETAYTPLADRVGRGLLPGADGLTLDPDEQKRIQDDVTKILRRALVSTSIAKSARFLMEAGQIVVSNEPVTLTGRVLVAIKGYPKEFEVEVGVDITPAS